MSKNILEVIGRSQREEIESLRRELSRYKDLCSNHEQTIEELQERLEDIQYKVISKSIEDKDIKERQKYLYI